MLLTGLLDFFQLYAKFHPKLLSFFIFNSYNYRGGRTSLHHAVYNGYYEMTYFLLQSGCAVNACDRKNRRALHYASRMGYDSVVQLLLERDADVNAKVSIDIYILALCVSITDE